MLDTTTTETQSTQRLHRVEFNLRHYPPMRTGSAGAGFCVLISSMEKDEKQRPFVEGEDYYFENGLMVLTARYLLRRGYCCEQGCRHCPYDNKNKTSSTDYIDDQQ